MGMPADEVVARPARKKRFTNPRRSPSTGPNRVIRTGGGVRVAVVGVDLENPQNTVDKIREIKRGRAAVRLPFDQTD